MARFQTHKENIPPSSISFQLSVNEYEDEEPEENLEERIEEYKRKNPEQLEELTSFVDDVIKEAKIKVAEKQVISSINYSNSFLVSRHFLRNILLRLPESGSTKNNQIFM